MSITVDIKRASGIIVSVKPDDNSSIRKELMGDEVATLSFELNAKYNFNIGDFAEILGETYYLTKPAIINKKSRFNYYYTLSMETVQCKLKNAQYLFYTPQNEIGEPDFSLTGTAQDFMNLLLINANRVGAIWTMGGVIQTGYKTLTFSKEDCLSVLSRLAEAFETEFFITGSRINLARKQQVVPRTFMYGRENGLYEITQDEGPDSLITRLYVYGSSQNLPNTYRNFTTRLQMNPQEQCLLSDLSCVVTPNLLLSLNAYDFTFVPPLSPLVTEILMEYRVAGSSDPWLSESVNLGPTYSTTLPLADYEFRFRSVGGPCDTQVTSTAQIFETTTQLLYQRISVLEKNTNLYGVIEGSVIFEDIYPERVGVVTATDLSSPYKFKDTTLDFDINSHLLPGISAKVVFNTGQLAGYKFEIKAFDNPTKEFTILKNKDEKALDIPNGFIKPAIGDKYILIDMLMPQSYVDAAEQRLRQKATEYLDLKAVPSFKYTVVCDPAFFRANKINMAIGDMIFLSDAELGVHQQIRVIAMTRNLVDEYSYELDLGESNGISRIAAIESAQTVTSSTANQTAATYAQNPLFDGQHIGTLKILQGTIDMPDIETAASLTGMKPLYIDSSGKIWKSP